MQPNALINIAGIIMIVVSGIGIAVYEEPEYEAGPPIKFKTYGLSFSENSGGLPNLGGSIPDGQSDTVDIPIDHANLTSLTFAIDWQDNFIGVRTPTVTVSLSGPDGQSDSYQGSGSSGSATFTFEDINDIPEAEESVKLEETESISEHIEENYPSTNNGTGSWEFIISVDRAVIRPTISGSVDFIISTNFDYYQLEISEAE